MTSNRAVTPAELDALLERLIIGNPTPSGRRLLGVEFEQLVLHRRSRASAPVEISVGVMRDLVAALHAEPVVEGELIKGLRADDFELSMEPGGQLEVATPPHEKLADIDRTMRRALAAIDRQLASTEYELVALGHAPVTPVAEIGLLPRQRYHIMDARMPTRGALSRNMMRATAGFQLTYDVDDRDDASRKLALLYRLSPVLLAISANSRFVGGVDSGYASFRHHVWWQTDRDRSGVPPGCMQPETAIDGYIAYAKSAHVLFLVRGDGLIPAPDEPLATLVARGEIREADIDMHLSGLFPFVRLRNYLELRCFDALPWDECRGLLALVSGLVYCDKAYAAAEALSRSLLVDAPDAIRALHEDAARRGLDAIAPDGRALRSLALEMADIARATLGGEACRWAEPADLATVVARIGGATQETAPE